MLIFVKTISNLKNNDKSDFRESSRFDDCSKAQNVMNNRGNVEHTTGAVIIAIAEVAKRCLSP